MLTKRSLFGLALSLGVLASACSGSDDQTVDSSTTTNSTTTTQSEGVEEVSETDVPAEAELANPDFPLTIDSAGGTWTLESPPERIVSLSPTATEILFAVGAGDQVVAVDTYSYYPAEAPVTDLSGFDPNVEAVVEFAPDLVVLANDANDLVAALSALDIPVLVSPAPADIEGGYATMAEIGIAAGRADETAEAIADLRSEIDQAFAAAPDTSIRVYHELDDTYFSASSFGFIGAVYAAMGAVNIADEADTDQFGFPQLTEEYIVQADPQLIVITDQVSYTAEDVLARPGWDGIDAVAKGNVVVVNADIASRWGPRLPQFIEAIASAMSGVQVNS